MDEVTEARSQKSKLLCFIQSAGFGEGNSAQYKILAVPGIIYAILADNKGY
jgi:hypothetical protein